MIRAPQAGATHPVVNGEICGGTRVECDLARHAPSAVLCAQHLEPERARRVEAILALVHDGAARVQAFGGADVSMWWRIGKEHETYTARREFAYTVAEDQRGRCVRRDMHLPLVATTRIALYTRLFGITAPCTHESADEERPCNTGRGCYARRQAR